jgi:hypothetical protein
MMGGEARPGSPMGRDRHHMIDLNVGGKIFTTTTQTLTALSPANSGRITAIGSHAAAFLSSSSGSDEDLGALRDQLALLNVIVTNQTPPARSGGDRLELFIDRSPECFQVVLDLLRTGRMLVPPIASVDMAEEELRYYGVPTEGTCQPLKSEMS